MKALLIEDGYYLYPESIETFAELVEMVNRNPDVFIHFRGFSDIQHFPYLMKENIIDSALKFRNIRIVKETEITLMNKAEYDRELMAYCRSYCKDCMHFTDEDDEHFNLESHDNNLTLHGRCWRREVKEEQ